MLKNRIQSGLISLLIIGSCQDVSAFKRAAPSTTPRLSKRLRHEPRELSNGELTASQIEFSQPIKDIALQFSSQNRITPQLGGIVLEYHTLNDLLTREPQTTFGRYTVTKNENSIQIEHAQTPPGTLEKYVITPGRLAFFHPDGKTVSLYHPGLFYEGNHLNGIPHGKGQHTFSQGGHYIGEYRHEKMHGQGKYTFPNGEIYEGAFHEDKIQGVGTWTYSHGGVWRGTFRDEIPVMKTGQWTTLPRAFLRAQVFADIASEKISIQDIERLKSPPNHLLASNASASEELIRMAKAIEDNIFTKEELVSIGTRMTPEMIGEEGVFGLPAKKLIPLSQLHEWVRLYSLGDDKQKQSIEELLGEVAASLRVKKHIKKAKIHCKILVRF